MNRRFLATQLAQGFGAPKPGNPFCGWRRLARARWPSCGARGAAVRARGLDGAFAADRPPCRRGRRLRGVERLAYQFLTTYLPEDILTKTDRASMFNSLEVRAPFLGRELAEYACALPTRLKLRRRRSRSTS